MPLPTPPPRQRKLRTDAQQNRIRILQAAKDAFTRSGADASLDDIARQAGVGPGTLYRHFPTRGDLLTAVYQADAENLAAAERQLGAEVPPADALRAWLMLFIDHVAAKRIIAPALDGLVDNPSRIYEATYAGIWQAVRALAARAVASGDLRADLDPVDLLRAVLGVANLAAAPDWEHSARRLVDILLTGARPGG